MWRVRGILQFLALYYLWISLLPSHQTIFGYNQSKILTYMFFGNIIGSTVFSTRAAGLGEEINNGNLSNHLIRPINYFMVWAATDAGDKAMNIFFAAGEFALLFMVLKPPLIIQGSVFLIFLTLISVVLATVLIFYINILLGSIGFWSNETWAPRFIFGILLQFFSGVYFPLDIFPKPIFAVFQVTPFPYLIFFPLKIYLGQLSNSEIVYGFFISGIWAVIMYYFARYVWTVGIKSYTAQGR